MAEQIERFSHALEDYYTEPKAIKDGSCRCHSKMVAAPRSGEWVRFTDHEKAVAAALARASASGVTKNLGVETKRMEDENLD